MTISEILQRLGKHKKEGAGWKVFCPAHDDRAASLSVSVGRGGEKLVMKCHAGCGFAAIRDAAGLKNEDFVLIHKLRPTITAAYDYRDQDGKLLYQAVRMEPGRDGQRKSFFQRRPDGAGGWINKLEPHIRRVPYRLPELIAAPPGVLVWINEGEKACDLFAAKGLVTTKAVSGAGKWPAGAEFNKYFKGRKCVVIADNDPCHNVVKPGKRGESDPVLCGELVTGPNAPKQCKGKGGPKHHYAGLDHALDISAKLRGFADDVFILTALELGGLPAKADAFDWFTAGHTVQELEKIASGLPSAWKLIQDEEDEAPQVAWRGVGLAVGPSGLTHDLLREWWIEEKPPTVFARGDFYRYSDKTGLWAVLGEYLIKKEMTSVIERAKSEKLKPTSGILASVYELAKAKIAIKDDVFDSDPNYIVCGNGALRIADRVLEPHRAGLYATAGVPYDYDKKAKCPHWLAYLERLAKQISEDTVAFLQRFAGLCLTTDTSHEVALWLYGPRGSGKSTFIEGLTAAAGDRYCVLGLGDINESRFMLAQLLGKTLAISTEQPAEYRRAFHVVDALISGEPVAIDLKFRDAVTIRSFAKFVWAMDELPRVSNPNSGIFRRAKIVRFPALPKKERDRKVKLGIAQEGAGILRWALDGLDALKKDGVFTIPASVRRATEQFEEANDIPGAFRDEMLELDESWNVQGSVLYEAYADWCKKTGHRPMSSTRVADEWRRLGFEHYAKKGRNFWRGCRIRIDPVRQDNEPETWTIE